MYTIIPTHGHYEIRDGPTFIQSADTYREAQHELASLINRASRTLQIFVHWPNAKERTTLCLPSVSTKPLSPSPPP